MAMRHKKLMAVILSITMLAITLGQSISAAPAPAYTYFAQDLDVVMDQFVTAKHWDRTLIDNPPDRSDTWTSTYGGYTVRWVNDYQRKYVTDAISQTGMYLWNLPAVIGSGDGSGMVSVAASQIGNTGGQPYWSYMGWGHRVPWCAAFVSWCANQCGLDDSIIPQTASAGNMRGIMRSRGREFSPVGFTPEPGDLIFFIWPGNTASTLANHVGIVEKVEGGMVHTIEGNTGDRCLRRKYNLTDSAIVGYARPPYPESAPAAPGANPSPSPGP